MQLGEIKHLDLSLNGQHVYDKVARTRVSPEKQFLKKRKDYRVRRL